MMGRTIAKTTLGRDRPSVRRGVKSEATRLDWTGEKSERERGERIRAIERMRPRLLRVATLQIRDHDLAEDVVQDTLFAAVEALDTFRESSKLSTWVGGILRFKILDAIRARSRLVPESSLDPETRTDDLDARFDGGGVWRAKPLDWESAGASTDRRDFMRVLEGCLSGLPPRTAQAFLLREVQELEVEEIGEAIALSRNHVSVLLYRARMALRECLESRWFADPPGGAS